MAACKYSDGYSTCRRSANEPHDNEYCIFHAPKDKKGISGEEFERLIFEQVEGKNYNFKKYIFPESIDFNKLLKNGEFDKHVDFSGAQFNGDAGFGDVQFRGDADFKGTTFNDYANFVGAHFILTTIFEEARFNGYTDFVQAHFKGDADFGGAHFILTTIFGGTHFYKGASFLRAHFNGDVYFSDFSFKNTMTFIEAQFSENSKFVLASPHFLYQEKQSAEPSAKIEFEKIKFIPHLTYFENIKVDSYNIRSHLPFGLIIFRYCNLTDVYFTKCNLSMISFYKSQFNAALFYSNSWDESRKNVICDELLYKYVRSQEDGGRLIGFRETYRIEDLDSYTEIASLYCSFKNALDSIKNYSESGLFYFNEFEMKRKALWHECKDKQKKWYGKLRELGYFILYSLYRILMGYGEKPSWSFGWLFLSFTIFLMTYLFGGLKINDVKTINYDLAWKAPDFGSLFYDLGTAAIFFISRILPINYVPKQWQDITYDGWGLIPFANTLILILFIIFIGIGIKRHFRRF